MIALQACEHEGCREEGIGCFLPDDGEPSHYLCATHCHEEGFCWACGNFWAGCESFDFSRNGLCSNCRNDPDVTGEADPDDDDGYSLGEDGLP